MEITEERKEEKDGKDRWWRKIRHKEYIKEDDIHKRARTQTHTHIEED